MPEPVSQFPNVPEAVPEIIRHFQIEGRCVDLRPYGAGHINDTYCSSFEDGARVSRYIHQRINHLIFKQPEQVMENIQRVTAYARERILEAGGDPLRETLTLVPALDGEIFYRTADGNTWRTYLFIEGARTYDQAESPEVVYQAARAFGAFPLLVAGLPGPRLHETIPGFHYTPGRLANFKQALAADAFQRAASIQPEIEFILRREPMTHVVVDLLASGAIPERVTHNDTKLNNVMIDEITRRGVCVIDLDTVMPGSVLYDFGDAVRIGASTAAEDERDLSRVQVDLALFERFTSGYCSTIGAALTPAEVDHLAFSARLITLEIAMRFLTDYLSGDVYYKTHRPGHNLDRCRTQLKMVDEMEQRQAEMEQIVQRAIQSIHSN